jgi:hypothetical protein
LRRLTLEMKKLLIQSQQKLTRPHWKCGSHLKIKMRCKWSKHLLHGRWDMLFLPIIYCFECLSINLMHHGHFLFSMMKQVWLMWL